MTFLDSPLELIIFDCDGVLVDSERIANTIFARILKEEYNLEFSLDQMFEHFVGKTSQQCLDIIESMIGYPCDESLEIRYKSEINDALAKTVTAVPGVTELLNSLATPYCVASNGSHEKMDLTLGKTGLLKYFQGKKFSAMDVKRGKPFPDLYLYAANQMGVDAYQHCLVVEDSPTGITGAVAAGMRTVGYAELMSTERLTVAGADQIVETILDIQNLTGVKTR
jgi:HAD superfamily hydrolase (TIGR01509 family)